MDEPCQGRVTLGIRRVYPGGLSVLEQVSHSTKLLELTELLDSALRRRV